MLCACQDSLHCLHLRVILLGTFLQCFSRFLKPTWSHVSPLDKAQRLLTLQDLVRMGIHVGHYMQPSVRAPEATTVTCLQLDEGACTVNVQQCQEAVI